MSKTRLEELAEQMAAEIQENKKWNERAVTNEALDHKLNVVLEIVLDTQKRTGEVEKQIVIMKDILNDHTQRLHRLGDRL